ncbi:MAG TPA: crossover junction endodeoxyribonuclease RuvC, partial [Chitinophagaceae bacterium]|nr:crossover junction endodeoxyribonuclease RuvC [Chitinophagaceae bacterium]
PIQEYSPKKVKQSVTGNGNAAKEQVMKMLQQLLAFKDNPRHYDATDALAVAVCHHFQQRTVVPGKEAKASNWKDFIAKNPGKVRK